MGASGRTVTASADGWLAGSLVDVPSICPIQRNRAGKTTSDETRQQVTPIVSTRPRLSSPRWLAIIRLPKPTIVVSDVINTALAVDALIR